MSARTEAALRLLAVAEDAMRHGSLSLDTSELRELMTQAEAPIPEFHKYVSLWSKEVCEMCAREGRLYPAGGDASLVAALPVISQAQIAEELARCELSRDCPDCAGMGCGTCRRAKP